MSNFYKDTLEMTMFHHPFIAFSELKKISIQPFSISFETQMENSLHGIVTGNQISSVALARFLADPAEKLHLPSPDDNEVQVLKQCRKALTLNNRNGFARGFREHVRLGPKITETVKSKLSLGARILQVGGVRKVYKKLFAVREGEKLLKASQCYLSTTAGPIAGLLFISTEKLAFCSDRSIKVSSPNGEQMRIQYKVVIPLGKIKGVNQSENMKKPSQKYMEIITVDNFDFWFMGFLNYQKAFQFLRDVLYQA